MRLEKLYTRFCSNNLINNYKNIIIGNVSNVIGAADSNPYSLKNCH